MYLRSADAIDCAALARLRTASLLELGVIARPQVRPFLITAGREFARLFSEHRIDAWVLVRPDGTLAGSACAVFYDRLPYPDGTEHAEIAGVYVEPEHRGRGFASELVKETVAAARGRGVRATFLRPSSDAARRLYGRLGFDEMPFMRLSARPES